MHNQLFKFFCAQKMWIVIRNIIKANIIKLVYYVFGKLKIIITFNLNSKLHFRINIIIVIHWNAKHKKNFRNSLYCFTDLQLIYNCWHKIKLQIHQWVNIKIIVKLREFDQNGQLAFRISVASKEFLRRMFWNGSSKKFL